MTEETIFLSAIEKKDATDRDAYLDDACKGDSALRERVEALLRSHADPDSFLNVPAVARQVQGTDEPARTTDLPSGHEKRPTQKRREGETTARDDVLALLARGKDLGSLGRLDHYEILEVVGEGGMGVVFKVRDTKLQRIVAVKVLAPQVAVNGSVRKRFIREAQAGAAVRDDHVVAIYAVSDEGSVPYLAMEFIGGVTLEQQIKRSGPMKVKEILRIGMQTAEGLAAAHRQGLIHRDVKPANILLENSVQRVKITDFGLARAADNASLTQPGLIAGTPLYMSPEQVRGETLDQRSDLFSLGSVLYILCTGQSAFSAGNTLAVMKRVCEGTPRSIRDVNPDIPEWLAAVVGKLLAKEKEERFQTATELAEVLGQHLAQIQQPGMAVPPVAEVREEALHVVHQARPGRMMGRKGKWLVAGAALLALVFIAVLSRWWPPPHSTEQVEVPPPPPNDPNVLTVSKNPKDGARYSTIQAALDVVQPEMTIRVLDDAVYEEYLLINSREKYLGVILEATRGATIRKQTGGSEEAVMIRGVSGFTLRGFRFEPLAGRHPAQVRINAACSGVVLDQLVMTADENAACVVLYDLPLSRKNDPIVIQNCTMRNGGRGVLIRGREVTNLDRPLSIGHVSIRGNTLVGCNEGVTLEGAVHKVHVVGNCILNTRYSAIELSDLLPGAADILIANNTLLRNDTALRVWDDHSKGKDFLKCKNIRVINNLVLETVDPLDMLFFDHFRGKGNTSRPGDLKSLLNSPEWRFSHNWREIDLTKATRFEDRWIPGRPNDHLEVSIKGLNRKLGQPDFVRPTKDSPLATGGVNDGTLPAYIGAVPPERVEAWDWEKTWKALAR